jgi:hypothetical protein
LVAAVGVGRHVAVAVCARHVDGCEQHFPYQSAGEKCSWHPAATQPPTARGDPAPTSMPPNYPQPLMDVVDIDLVEFPCYQ